MNKPPTHSYAFGRFSLDVERERLLKGTEPVELTPTEYRVLLYLIEHRDRTVSVSRLLDGVWEGAAIEGNNVHQIICGLRKKLRGSVREHKYKYIKTEPRKGYCFSANVIPQADTDGPEPTPPHPQPDPGPDPIPPHPQPGPSHLEELTFSKWVFKSGWKATITLAAGLCLVIVLSVSNQIKAGERLSALCSLNFVVIAFALLFNPRARGSAAFRHADPALEAEIMEDCGYADHPEEWEEAKVQADESLKQHDIWWKVLLASWALLYLALTFKELGLTGNSALSVVVTLFNNCGTLALTLCYIVLNEITVLRERDQTVSDVPWRVGLFILGGITVAEVFLVVVAAQNALALPVSTAEIIKGADWLSGVLAGVAMALYAGRLQSKFLGPPLWLPILFYLYAAIQPLYALIGENQNWAVLLISGALALKCLLYLYLLWLSSSGRFLFYFLRVRPVYERLGAEWKNFHSIFAEKSKNQHS